MELPKNDAELLKKIQDKVDAWYSFWAENNEHYKQQFSFIMGGEQWDESSVTSFKQSDTYPFTMNMLKKMANSILGEQQRNTSDFQVVPLDEKANKNSATIIQNILRTISLSTNSKEAEQVEFISKTIGGYGAIRLEHDYEDIDTFNQNILIKAVYDPTTCGWDPQAKESHKGDGKYCFYYYTVSKDEYKKAIGKDEIKELKSFSLPLSNFQWSTEGSAVCLYFYEKKFKEKKILLLEDNTAIEEEKYKAISEAVALGMLEKAPEIIDERMVSDVEIIAYKFIGEYLVEKTIFPGKELPIIFGKGACDYVLNGKQVIKGFFADAEGAQIYRNYLVSKSADLVKKYNPAQWIGDNENFEGNEEYWQNPSRVASALPYKAKVDPVTGALIRPEKVPPSTLPPHLFEQTQLAGNDIPNIVGVYDSQLGAQGNEVSGAAIDARTERGSNNTFVLFNASHMLIDRMGKVMLGMIKELYQTERLLALDTQEEGMQQVAINQKVDEYTINNDIVNGKYGVVVKAGSSFEAQKRQYLEMLMQFAQSVGVINTPIGQFSGAQYFGDIILDAIPLPGMNEASGRMKYAIPEQIVAAGKGKKIPPPPPHPNQQVELANKKLAVEDKRIEAEMIKQNQRSAAEIMKANIDKESSYMNSITKLLEHNIKRGEMLMRHKEATFNHLSNFNNRG